MQLYNAAKFQKKTGALKGMGVKKKKKKDYVNMQISVPKW